ncbi:LacI family DNA-binding transcriptional regulator [Cohnella lupini]|uniref:LacI family transcriptional regulator n=1 Tax=Cohnella lupini TaxID=1294267 RepID=A0A3D9HNU6_9BACL|nr:LacI family DNA-binding transcriptional regulator [Cohnella lupini]RED51174.1 LacI family transcriptional regulator [Cohnella lupini]
MTTIADVAKATGVSKGTVSSVFSKKRPISKEVTERVLEAARALNYKPNYWARSLANKSTRILGLNIPGEKFKFSQFHLSLMNGVLRVCYDHGYRLLVNTLPQTFLDRVENISSDPVDGEIILDPEADDLRIEDRLNREVPIVLVGRPSKAYDNRVSYVDNDNVGMTGQITRYLLELGHRNFLFLNAPKHRTVASDRELGFLTACQEFGMEQTSHQIVHKPDTINSSLDFGYETTLATLRKMPEISAIIADSDTMALGAYKAAQKLGIQIPEQLSVFAFSDDSVFSPEFTPPLTGVRLNAEQLGIEAATILIEQLKKEAKTINRTIVPTEMIIRSSCAHRNIEMGGNHS